MPRVGVDHIVGRSSWTESLRDQILQVSGHDTGVLILGPSGTGKDLVARAIHNHSPRRSAPFIPVNCAAVPEGLFASHLFGHRKGAFTGAHREALGCFRAADGGTLFLDAVGELSVDLQAMLLRSIQERQVTPVGSDKPVAVDVRVVAATNRDLEADVRVGRFRLDLFYRLNVVTIETVGLAERPDDVELLAKHYLAKAAIEHDVPLKRLSRPALERLMAYSWPGNVRQLQNMIERAVLFTDGQTIGPEAFMEAAPVLSAADRGALDGLEHPVDERAAPRDEVFSAEWPSPASNGEAIPSDEIEVEAHGEPARQFDPFRDSWHAPRDNRWPTLEDVEREHLRKTLQKTYFNQTAAAKILGINRKLLASKIERYGLDVPTRRKPR